jgi:CubicO group peptidase (beta-lactamase class C family)
MAAIQGGLDMARNSRKIVFGLWMCLIVAAGCADATPLAEQIDSVMGEFVELDLFSGSVLVAREGDIVYAGAFGEANKDHRVASKLETRLNIGSIGKVFTGVGIMQLVERGRIELDAPVLRYLEYFPYGDAITIHHLLSHTSGMFNYMAHPDYRANTSRLRRISDFLPLIYDQQLVFETPGERFAYSNSGIVVLGAVIEKVSGQPYDEYIREHILMPAGMFDTGINFWDEVVSNRAMGYTKSATGGFSAAVFQIPPASADGGIETTVLDLLKFDRALYGDGLLKEASKSRMFTPNLNQYGYCWRITNDGGRMSIGHGGGAPGVSASFMRYPDDDVTIIVLSNYSGGAIEPARALEAIVFGEEFSAPRRPVGELLYRAMHEADVEVTAKGLGALLEQEGYELRSSRPLNFLGYELLGAGENDMAIAVFELNVDRFPDEANPYDSLAEAYLATGDRERAITLYRRALAVDPEFENARRMLEKLSAEHD